MLVGKYDISFRLSEKAAIKDLDVSASLVHYRSFPYHQNRFHAVVVTEKHGLDRWQRGRLLW